MHTTMSYVWKVALASRWRSTIKVWTSVPNWFICSLSEPCLELSKPHIVCVKCKMHSRQISKYWFTWFSRCIVYVEHKWKNKARLIIFQDFLYVNYTELVPQYGMICFIANQIKYNMNLIYLFLYKNGFCKSVYPNTILIHCKNIIT